MRGVPTLYDVVNWADSAGGIPPEVSIEINPGGTYFTLWNYEVSEGRADSVGRWVKRHFGPLKQLGSPGNVHDEGYTTIPLAEGGEYRARISWYGRWKCEITSTVKVEETIPESEMSYLRSRLDRLSEEVQTGKRKKVVNSYNCRPKGKE